MTLSRSALTAVAARALSIAASLGVTVTVARSLEQAAAGAYFVIATTVLIAATFGRFGTENLALKLLSDPKAQLFKISMQLFGIVCAVSLFCVVALLSAGHVLVRILDGLTTEIIVLAASVVIPQAIAVVAGAVLRARGKLITGTIAEIGSIPLFTLFYFWLLQRVDSLTLEEAVTASALAAWSTILWAIPWALKSVWGTRRRGGQHPGFVTFCKKHVRSLSAMMGSGLLFLLITWMPVYLLSLSGSYEQVALYNSAVRLVGFIGLIPAMQISYLAPNFARLFQKRDIQGLNAVCKRSTLVAVVIAAVPGLVLIAFGPLLLEVGFGPAYVDAALILKILTVGVLFTISLGQVSQLMLLCDLEWYSLYLNVSVALLWLALGIPGAIIFGVYGVAVLNVLLTGLYAVVATKRLRRSHGIRSGLL